MISPSPTKDRGIGGIGDGAAFGTSVPNTPSTTKQMLQTCTGRAVACLDKAKRVLSCQEEFN